MISAFTPVVACLRRINSFQMHTPIKSNFKKLFKTSSGNNVSVGFVVFFFFFLVGFYFTEVEMTRKCFLIRFWWDRWIFHLRTGTTFLTLQRWVYIVDDTSPIIFSVPEIMAVTLSQSCIWHVPYIPAAPVNSHGLSSKLFFDHCLLDSKQFWNGPHLYVMSHTTETPSSLYWPRKMLCISAWSILLILKTPWDHAFYVFTTGTRFQPGAFEYNIIML